MKQVKAKKQLGQHFLTDLGIARRIADTVDSCPDIPVLEIGPGMGVMTQYLKQKQRPFKVVEIDKESVEYLAERWPDFTPQVISGDFLRMDLTKVFDGKQFVPECFQIFDLDTTGNILTEIPDKFIIGGASEFNWLDLRNFPNRDTAFRSQKR
jgi:16S rRNA A1518/A1519 N6-dimethyltransferase RsmA/KsgA/DIM1 with predicted DNA glycosylase/AP lyase activity